MKFVYVLVSSERDTYLEQTLISIKSLQMRTPKAEIYVILDSDTANTLTKKREALKSCGAEIVSVELPAEMNSKDRSRFLKTKMRSYIEGAFLYIDGDTIICDDLNTFETDKCIGNVLDKHYYLSEHPSKNNIVDRANRCGYGTDWDDKHFNGGLMWVSDDPESYEFFELWHSLWDEARKKGVTQDQASLNEANIRMNGIISEVDGIWNCQISNRTGAMPYLEEAKIIHYFASYGNQGVPYDLSDKHILQSVLEEEWRPELIGALENPKKAFKSVCALLNDKNDADLFETDSYKRLKKFYQNRRGLFNFFEKFAHALNALDRRMHK